MSPVEQTGWDRLRHGGLLLDATRLAQVAAYMPAPLEFFHERELRQRVSVLMDGSTSAPDADFVSFVLEKVCGFTAATGSWQRGTHIGAEWGRRALTGETVKPRQIWRGPNDAILPVFFDSEARVGIGRGRKATSQTVHWLRSGKERLALLTNGRQWRLIFAGLDFDAWCEWDIDLWFEEGTISPQVNALRLLFSPKIWTPSQRDGPAPLLAAILDSRKGQSELSAVLGERVREAVELLVQSHGEVLKEKCADVDPSDIYRAAVRVVMRMVVVLFAESRELLPRDNVLYYGAYGIAGLLEELEKVAARGGNRMARSWNAWPRVLALFKLVHQGSHHPALPVPAYGGELFASGDPASTDGLSRALAVFETASFDLEIVADRDVHRILERITRTRIKVRQGHSITWVPAPVDFSDLSSEYIGILYEGLLDFELKTAPAGDPVIFLAVGNQPALPLSRLETMDDRALANLLEKMKDTSKGDESEEEDNDNETVEGAQAEVEDESADNLMSGEPSGEGTSDIEIEDGDERHNTRTRAETWARRGVEMGKLVHKPKGTMTPEKRLTYEDNVSQKARQLVIRVVLPGEWYVVRWGGTRKGSGTFYTRPGLAVPTVQRTLRPLAYTPPVRDDGSPDIHAPHSSWVPKKPEDILALKVCDPACGSGTFPVAALRFLTEALFASLHHHGRISEDGDRAVVQLLGASFTGSNTPEERLAHELLPCRPDDAFFEQRLKAILRRHVVERSIYGVDLDPLAVELCRLALWVETMDRTLPFSFLDHKIKCGNALIGAWFDQFQHYPVMAWKNREGGDKGHNNGVHFEKEARTKAIKDFVRNSLTSDTLDSVTGQLHLQKGRIDQPDRVHADALATLSRLHNLPVQDSAERARIYSQELIGSPAYRSLKSAMDLWCACWFWPLDRIEDAVLPSTITAPTEEARQIAIRLASLKRFFHWELEFPDVFCGSQSGFDATFGNPPWDIAKPNSKEYFSNIDPLYRSYGKQEALRYQTEYFRSQKIERDWLDYNADFRAQSNIMGYKASPFGDPIENEKSQDRFSIARGRENDNLHARWRATRARSQGFADPAHPFRHQGSADLNLYKAFLELAHALLRQDGRMGFIVPSGLYSDHGTGGLRELFFDRCQWEWLFGFENKDGIFDIHRSFKFAAVVLKKGGSTRAIQTVFMRRKLEDWERAEALATSYDRAQVERFSPRAKAILEIQSQRDLQILEKIYSSSELLGDEGPNGWGIKYAREFDMSNDSKLFPGRPKWETEGYRADEYSRWLKGDWRPIAELWNELGVKALPEGELHCAQPPYDTMPVARAEIPAGIIISREANAWIREDRVEDAALPLYQGLMIWNFDCAFNGWESGTGRSAKWHQINWQRKYLEPQYLMSLSDYSSREKAIKGVKVCSRRITTAVHQRTAVVSLVPNFPCGDVASVIQPSTLQDKLLLPAALNLFAVDFVAKKSCTYLHLDWHVLDSLPAPRLPASIVDLVVSLSCVLTNFAPLRLQLESMGLVRAVEIGLTPAERLRLDINIQAVGLAVLGLSRDDVQFMFKDCDQPHSYLNSSNSSGLDPKGFWRVGKDKDPELRHTVLTLVAFHDLEEKIVSCGGDREKGVDAFLVQNDGEGWMLPDTLCLADYNLGHDERAKRSQSVAGQLGPRFYDWQLAQSAEESWRECHLHARNLLGELSYRQLFSEIEAEKRGIKVDPPTAQAVGAAAVRNAQRSLFE